MDRGRTFFFGATNFMKRLSPFLLVAALLGGCDHHQATTRTVPVQRGDSALTGIAPQPLDSMKYPRATLVALPPGSQTVAAPKTTAPDSSDSAVVAVTPAPAADFVPAATPSATTAPASVDAPVLASTEGTAAASTETTSATAGAPAETTASDSSSVVTSINSGNDANPAPATTGAVPASLPPSVPQAPNDNQVVVIRTSDGDIVIELDDFAAPKTCKNFRQLIADGFYNNTVFHRVIPGFIIQGGDPKSKSSATNRDTYGMGSPGYTLPPEISLKHDRGAVAMARLPDEVNPNRESNGSQFYICLQACPSLDDQYTVFGHVVKGLDVAEKIGNEARDRRDNPLKRIEMTMIMEPKEEALGNSSAANP
jgi:peptidyl-prolyl cis-trans isomerase B (cyclophilin B)